MFALDDIYRYTPFAKTLAKYSSGVLLCLQTQSAPAFSNTRNIDKDIIVLLQEKKIDAKGDPLYSLDMTPEDKAALRMPVEEAIKALDSLINKDAATEMARSFLQCRRYLRLGNRYLNKGYSTSATKSYMFSLDILEKIQDKLPVKEVQEHKYKLYLQLAKTNAYQDKSQDAFLHEQGIVFAQQAQDIAEQFKNSDEGNIKYHDRYYNVLVRKASLHTNAGQTGTAIMLYDLAEKYYQEKKRNEDIAIIYRNKAAIEYEQKQFDEALALMEEADIYFQKHFTQTGQLPNSNYKIFLLNYGTYLVNTFHLQEAKNCLAKQESIPTDNNDIQLLVDKLDLAIQYIQADTYAEKIAVKNKETEIEEEQKKIDKSRENGDTRTKYGTDEAIEKAEEERKDRILAEQLKELAVKGQQLAISEAEKATANAETEKAKAEKSEAQAETAKAETETEKAKTELAEQESRNFQIGLFLSMFIAMGLGIGVRQYKKKNKLIEAKNEELSEKNTLIAEQKAAVDDLLEQLGDALRAGGSIQGHHLDNAKIMLERHLPEHFIFHSPSKPENKVSGDFYRSERRGNKTYLVTGDCTGHGVEGALTSVLMYVLLFIMNQEEVEKNAGVMLDILHRYVSTLNQKKQKADGTKDRDMRSGMDASLSIYDEEARTLEFAGAKHPVYILRQQDQYNEEDVKDLQIKRDRKTDEIPQTDDYILLECVTNSQAIGDDKDEAFVQYTVNLQPGDTVFTFSDGYQDQPGGPNGKKFMIKQMREILLSLGGLSLDEQKRIIQETFYTRQGAEKQIDDVLVIGIQVPEKETETA